MDPPRYTPVSKLARGQGGHVHEDQLLDAGFSRDWVRHKVDIGYLLPEHRRVYAVGHRPGTRYAAWHAAQLLVGKKGAIGGMSALAVHGAAVEPTRRVEVVTTRNLRSTPKVHIRRTRTLPDGHVMVRNGLRVTTPLRTVLDCAGWLAPDELVKVTMELDFQQKLSLSSLPAAQLPGRGGAAWAHLLRHITEGTRTELEMAFLELCVVHEIPRPEVNQRVAGVRPDFLWREQRFVVETDGWGVHQTRRQFERDRAKVARLVAAGYDVLPTTWRQVRHQPGLVATAIRRRLA